MKTVLQIIFFLFLAVGIYIVGFYQTPAQRHFERALLLAQQGQESAFYEVAQLYARGQGTKPDGIQAAEWYRKAVAAGNMQAARELADLYLQGGTLEQDVEEALVYLQMAARGGDKSAQKELARFYKEGLAGLAENEEASLFWCMHAAAQGDEECQAQVKESFSKQREQYKKALSAFTANMQGLLGYAPAALEFGRVYEDGILSPDWEEAAHWYTIAAEQHIPQAQARLGLLYAEGRGVGQDEEKARSLLAPAAEAGDPLAQLYWGKQAYTRGEEEGGPDYTEAFKWFMNAAAQGNMEAQYLTGVLYMQGLGTEKSVSKALQAFSRAAEAGHPDAQYVVGQSYYKGLGIRPNLAEAKKWLGKAAENGNQSAAQLLEEIQTQTVTAAAPTAQ